MILTPVTGQGINAFRWNVDLLGDKNGINITFTLSEQFVQSGTVIIRVYRNGQRLRLGATNDYTVSESGGLGTGYDTVTLAGPAPLAYEVITADYLTM